MGKKKKDNSDKKRLTASHCMLYVILIVYVCVIVTGIVFLRNCIERNDISSAVSVYATLAGLSTVCGTTTIGFYVVKAKKENEIQMSGNKYRMRLELAKDIYKEFKGKSLDEKSLQFMRTLISDNDIHFDNNDSTNINYDVNNIGNNISGLINSDDGLG